MNSLVKLAFPFFKKGKNVVTVVGALQKPLLVGEEAASALATLSKIENPTLLYKTYRELPGTLDENTLWELLQNVKDRHKLSVSYTGGNVKLPKRDFYKYKGGSNVVSPVVSVQVPVSVPTPVTVSALPRIPILKAMILTSLIGAGIGGAYYGYKKGFK